MARVRARVTIDRPAMHADLQRIGTKWGHGVGRAVTNEAKKLAPVDEGRLRSSIDYAVKATDTGVHVAVGSPLEYAHYLERGTGIYGPSGQPIVPVSKKALKFEARAVFEGRRGPTRVPKGKGTIVFARSVKGTPATRFLSRALEAVFPGRTRRP